MNGSANRQIAAVLFDFGGVFTNSPFKALQALGAEFGLSGEQVTAIVFGSYAQDGEHPWHRLERGEISLEDARQEILDLGRQQQGLEIDIYRLFQLMGSNNAGTNARLPLVRKVEALREQGYRLGVITNNIKEFGDKWRSALPRPVDELFHFIIDSSEVGVRKPDPRIFALAFEQLKGIRPQQMVFLDDFLANLDAAQALGLHTIHVGSDIEESIRALDQLLAKRLP